MAIVANGVKGNVMGEKFTLSRTIRFDEDMWHALEAFSRDTFNAGPHVGLRCLLALILSADDQRRLSRIDDQTEFALDASQIWHVAWKDRHNL